MRQGWRRGVQASPPPPYPQNKERLKFEKTRLLWQDLGRSLDIPSDQMLIEDSEQPAFGKDDGGVSILTKSDKQRKLKNKKERGRET